MEHRTIIMEKTIQIKRIKNIKKEINNHTDDVVEVLKFKVQDVYDQLEIIQKAMPVNKIQVISSGTDSEKSLGENNYGWPTLENSEESTNPKQERKSKKERKLGRRKQMHEGEENNENKFNIVDWVEDHGYSQLLTSKNYEYQTQNLNIFVTTRYMDQALTLLRVL